MKWILSRKAGSVKTQGYKLEVEPPMPTLHITADSELPGIPFLKFWTSWQILQIWSFHFLKMLLDGIFKNYKKGRCSNWASQVPVVKNPPVNARDTGDESSQVRSLAWKDPLEEEMATLSSILTWWILWTDEPGRLLSMVSQRIRHDWAQNRQNLDELSSSHSAFLEAFGMEPLLWSSSCSTWELVLICRILGASQIYWIRIFICTVSKCLINLSNRSLENS